ncbi:MAG TPA: hypothetical protein VMI56_28470 [Reyranella sp.]|nr:hypothetical protein [Reyranella sp.]
MKNRVSGIVSRAAGLMLLLLAAALPQSTTAQTGGNRSTTSESDSPAAPARVLPANILLGKWCGETSNYVFSNQKLVVYGLNGQVARELRIARFETGVNWISVFWADLPPVDGNAASTLFNNFSPGRDVMEQAKQTIGDKGPLRIFRRC